MAANVETMMYVRETPWHGLGTCVQEAPTSADALRLAGLDWNVVQKPIQVCGGKKIPNMKANVRDSDNSILGVVSDSYSVVQNIDAFSFTDSLIEGDVHYETAGSLNNGKRIWLLAKMPGVKVVGDDVDPYLCFSNTHDGSGAIKVCMTPIRVVCNNTLNIALDKAVRKWSTRHIGDLNQKMTEARICLEMAGSYMDNLVTYADHMANTHVSDDQIKKILDEMFPMDDDFTARKNTSSQKARDEFMICYLRPDIAQFINTAWGVVNAMSDMVTHSEPRRNTKDYRANNWGRIMDGHAMLDRTVELLGVR